MKKKLKPKIKLEFTLEAFKKWLVNYKFFNVLLCMALVVVGFTMWENRPNSMRTPNFTNTTNYSEVKGSYDFKDFYEIFNKEKNATVKSVHFKLENEYCYEMNEVALCVKGYELFETEKDVSLKSNYRISSAKHFLVAEIEIINSKDGPIEVSEFGYATGSDYSGTRSLRDTDIELPNNLGNIRYDEKLTVNPHSSYEGQIVYPFNPTSFRQLYFDGGVVVDMPEIINKNKVDSRSLFTMREGIEFPVIDSLIERHIETVNNLPTSTLGRSNGFTKVTSKIEPNVNLVNAQETISVTLDRVESGYFEYRPEYIARRRYRSSYEGKQYYSALKITLTNTGTSSMNTGQLKASLDLKSNSYLASGYLINRASTIDPGESVDLIFDYHERDAQSGQLKLGEVYRFVLSNESKEVLLESEFKLEQ